jgi:predicted ATPase
VSFERIIDAAIDLLRRRQRITYRALQREFALDDGALADLADELIRGQRLAYDEDGAVLVWSGTPAKAAERRRLTVMFCDLVGSTQLSRRLDPEDLHALLRRYQDDCATALRPFGGHIAQYLGDGILAYFGYPVAHEDDAERAVRAGLAVVQAARALSAEINQRFGVGLAVRVGLHTGLVVLGDIGPAERRETLALGEAPNLAAHIQAQAEPDSVLVSEATYALLRGRFAVDDRGLHSLKSDLPPQRLLRIVGERDPGERQRRRTRFMDPAGRLERLRSAWAHARQGHGAAIALRGEAGVGKTRLVEELRSLVHADDGDAMVLRCSAFHRHSALHPLAQLLARRAHLTPESSAEDVAEHLTSLLAQLEDPQANAQARLAALLMPSSAAAAPVAGLAPAQLMQATQALLLQWLRAASRRAPLLLVCEDVHWADASTLALLQRLIESLGGASLLLVLTTRPGFDAPWPDDALAEVIALERLPASAVREIVLDMARGRPLADSVVERIVEVAGGIPLFAEEIAKSVLDGAAAGTQIQVPESLHASLLARLDRLGSIKPLVQTAALLGREFDFELLAAVSERSPAELGEALHALVAADLLQRQGVPPQTRYSFRHALLQTAAEESLLRSARAATHGRIADTLEVRFPGTVDAEPETLARHRSEAGEPRRAIPLWLRAGERALSRSAVIEAMAHLDSGIAALPSVDAAPERERLELDLHILRASALRAARGIAAPDTGEAYERACALARAQDDTARLIPALNGLYSYHMVRGECDAAREPATELLRVAHERADATYEMIGHRAVGAVAFHVGEPQLAREHLERAIALYDPAQHAQLAFILGIDHRVGASNFLALSLFVLGEAEASLDVHRAALVHAEQLDHAHSTAQALVFGCLLLALHGDWRRLVPLAERTVALGRARGFPLMEGGGRFFLGAAMAQDGGDAEAALAVMEEGAQLWWGTGARNYRAYAQMLEAEVHVRLGHTERAKALLSAAHDGIAATGERWVEPELWRVEGEWLRGVDGEAASLAKLQHALKLAQAQGAQAWVQRAQASLDARQRAGTPATMP